MNALPPRLLPRRLLRYAARACAMAHAYSAEISVMALDQALYGEHEFGVIGRLTDPARIAIDVGAADGLYLHVLLTHASRCIGFEPNPISYQRLRTRFPQVRLEPCALSSAPGVARLRVPIVGGVSYSGFGTIEPQNTLPLEHEADQTFDVALEPLDRFGFDNVGMIKVDAEGHEWEVIQGAVATIDRSRPNLMIEIEERHKAGNFDRLTGFFESRGYGVFFLKDGWLRPRREFDFETLQNPAGPVRPGVYYNNFFFLSDPARYKDREQIVF